MMQNVTVITLGEVVQPFRKLLRDELISSCGLDIDQPYVDSGSLGSRYMSLRTSFYKILTSEIGSSLYVKIARTAQGVLGLNEHVPQLLPTPRVHIPGMRSASFHTDGWYGHSPSTKTVWVPFTKIDDSCALHFCDDHLYTQAVEDRARAQLADIYEIDKMAAERSSPVVCEIGDAIVFGSDILHGSLANNSGRIRVSFDFRLASLSAGFGSKPKGNFLNESEPSGRAGSPPPLGMKYITTAFSTPIAISGAAQHAVCDDYAERMQIDLGVAEAEIEPLDYGPTLLGYVRRLEGPKHVVMFSTTSMPRNKTAAKEILRACTANKITLHFAAEQVTFPFNLSEDEILARIGSY